MAGEDAYPTVKGGEVRQRIMQVMKLVNTSYKGVDKS